MKKGMIVILIVIMLMSINLVSCSTKDAASDYSQEENWLSLPADTTKDVDVFYLYPTAYFKSSNDDPDVCEIDNTMMISNAQKAFQRQATVFETVGNIYAPYYRQADAGTCLALSSEEQDELLSGVTKSDVFAAFDCYIKNYNNGRPFILAGHSQGSNMLLYLLTEYMKENPKVYDRMIAAYVIGYSVTNDYLNENEHLKFAQGSDDIGVIISYNTQAPDVAAGDNPVVLDGANVINPITWTRDEVPTSAEQNLGSIMLNSDGSVVLDDNNEFKRVMNYADACIDLNKGVIVCSTADEDSLAPGNDIFPRGVYHSFDYPFYYYNIRENAQNRVNIYLNAQ